MVNVVPFHQNCIGLVLNVVVDEVTMRGRCHRSMMSKCNDFVN